MNTSKYGVHIYNYLMGAVEPPKSEESREVMPLSVGTYRRESDKVCLVNLMMELTKESPL